MNDFYENQKKLSSEERKEYPELYLQNGVSLEDFCEMYYEISVSYNVNPVVAFAQMILETGYLSFAKPGEGVEVSQFNFAGIGAIKRGVYGKSFKTLREGILAHIQLLRAYATKEKPDNCIIEKSYESLKEINRLGSVPNVEGLAGTWAKDPNYATKIKKIMRNIERFDES